MSGCGRQNTVLFETVLLRSHVTDSVLDLSNDGLVVLSNALREKRALKHCRLYMGPSCMHAFRGAEGFSDTLQPAEGCLAKIGSSLEFQTTSDL